MGGGDRQDEYKVLSGLRILLVDDNVDLVEMFKELLESSGCHVEVTHDGPEGVERALATKPQIAIIDIGLPTISGYETARRIRAGLDAETRMRLVAASGYGQLEDRQKAFEAGFDEHLVKPVDMRQLVKLVARWFGDSRSGAR